MMSVDGARYPEGYSSGIGRSRAPAWPAGQCEPRSVAHNGGYATKSRGSTIGRAGYPARSGGNPFSSNGDWQQPLTGASSTFCRFNAHPQPSSRGYGGWTPPAASDTESSSSSSDEGPIVPTAKKASGGSSHLGQHNTGDNVRCSGCNSSISGKYVVVEGKSYHKECFKCAKCFRPIEGSFLKTDEFGYLCSSCQPKCPFCQKKLAGCATVTIDGQQIHADCFKCSGCGHVLRGGHFEAGPGKYQCQTCYAAAWQARQDESENRRMAEERFLKRRDTTEFRLEWRPELVPSLRQTLRLMGVGDPRLARCKQVCICLDPKSGTVSCAPAPDHRPQAMVNVSYLATALTVLHRHRREPQFSLDPKDPHDIGGTIQVKRFIPSWLARTVVGEVLFQADYELKKICMGETRLPAIPDAFSASSANDREDGHAARQWFVVRRAGITVSGDGALIPYCEMGVEARRLVPSPKGYVDAAHTDPEEPMVRNATLITTHFEEVAKQLPVVAELMALARATILARYLLERGCVLDESTLERLPPPMCPEGQEYAMEIPTLRRKRTNSSISVEDGQLSMQTQERSIHGGVDLGVPSKKVAVKQVAQRLLEPDERRAPLPLFVSRASAARAA